MLLRFFSHLKSHVSYLLFCILIFSCTGTRDLSVVNLSNLYRTSDYFFHPQFAVSHQSDSTSLLYTELKTKEFLFSRQSDDRFRARFTIRYRLVEAYEYINILLDSGSTKFTINEEEKNRSKIYTVPLKLPAKKEMLLIVTIHDDQKNFENEFYVAVDNSSSQSRESFSAQLKNENHAMFRNFIGDQDSVKISYRDSSVKKLYVRVYSRVFPLAPPPFSYDVRDEFDYAPNYTFTYDVNDTNYITLKQEGFYHFQNDTTSRSGFTLYLFPNSFPAVTSPEQMVECVRYLTTRREFDQMKENTNKKSVMDKFWIDLGGNTERTKVLIKKYYTRVREANEFFTSYTQGWRTDRGMIYILLGKPTSVYKSSTAESWVYGTPNNSYSLNFFFTKVINPFTDNDYLLTREPLFESSWMRAVDVWRQGRVYNDN